MSKANDPLQIEKKERAQKAQNELEYWKTQYDFQKHLMTLGLAASTGFIAILALPGFFLGIKDPEAKFPAKVHVKETYG